LLAFLAVNHSLFAINKGTNLLVFDTSKLCMLVEYIVNRVSHIS